LCPAGRQAGDKRRPYTIPIKRTPDIDHSAGRLRIFASSSTRECTFIFS
jgi:hypothetical protein